MMTKAQIAMIRANATLRIRTKLLEKYLDRVGAPPVPKKAKVNVKHNVPSPR